MRDLKQLLKYAIEGWPADVGRKGCERLNPKDTKSVVLRAIRFMDSAIQNAEPGSHEHQIREALSRAYEDIEGLRYAPVDRQAPWLSPKGATERYDPIKLRYQDAAVGYADGERARINRRTGKKGRHVNPQVAASYGVTAKTLNAWRTDYARSQAGEAPDILRCNTYEPAYEGKCIMQHTTVFADDGVGRLDFAQAEGIAYRAYIKRRAQNDTSHN